MRLEVFYTKTFMWLSCSVFFYLSEILGIKPYASICCVLRAMPLFEKQLKKHCRVFIKNQ